jgi:hypothetical protein
MAASDSLRVWLRNEITSILGRKSVPPSMVIWCDPERHWRNLLKAAAQDGTFELWSGEEHELILREQMLAAEAKPRVLWLPRSESDITYLKVFALQAEQVWTESLISALRRYGVEIARDRESELAPILPLHALEWIDRSLSGWADLTPGSVKSSVVTDNLILEALAHARDPLAAIVGRERMRIFERRIIEDFGLPPIAGKEDKEWLLAATSTLLVTEAASRMPSEQPRDTDRIIAPGPARDLALRLLDQWRKNVEFMATFEELSKEADARTTLTLWARSLVGPGPALASRAAEDSLFYKEVEDLGKLDQFEGLAARLKEREQFYRTHAEGFWGRHAEKRVPWRSLLGLASSAMLLAGETSAEKAWKSTADAVGWFVSRGWEIDREGEFLFREDKDLPGSLHAVRARLRKAYLRHLDRTNSAFSELLAHGGVDSLPLPFAGQLLARIRQTKEPMAVIVLDACRFDLAARLVDLLNQDEPVSRASIQPARAPLPSITALGMAFGLAEDPSALRVYLATEGSARWQVTVPPAKWNLTLAEDRRQWLRQTYKLKPAAITDDKTVLEGSAPVPKEAGRLVFVFGNEFDTAGHEGELSFAGADDYIERYARVVLRLRDSGYSVVAIVTDHGFIHWEPEKDEVEAKPEGERLWESRRAIVGHNLTHPTAIAAPVPQANLECRVPRSVNSFKAYGGIGFFHGGATLQELVIPVVKAEWPKKAAKITVVLTPLKEIATFNPRVEVRPGAADHFPGFGASAENLGRQVKIKVVEHGTGRKIMESAETVKIKPDGGPETVMLERVPNQTCRRGAKLTVEARDADNDEFLDHCEVEMKIDIEEWD